MHGLAAGAAHGLECPLERLFVAFRLQRKRALAAVAARLAVALEEDAALDELETLEGIETLEEMATLEAVDEAGGGGAPGLNEEGGAEFSDEL